MQFVNCTWGAAEMNDLLVAENLRGKKTSSVWIAPDAYEQNFFDIDKSLQGLVRRGAGTGGALIT